MITSIFQKGCLKRKIENIKKWFKKWHVEKLK